MGRPSSPITAEADAAQKAVLAYMRDRSLTKADIAKRTGYSPSTVGRVLETRPAKEAPALLKLHELLIQSQPAGAAIDTASLSEAMTAIDSSDARAAAQILRAIADLLDRPRR